MSDREIAEQDDFGQGGRRAGAGAGHIIEKPGVDAG